MKSKKPIILYFVIFLLSFIIVFVIGIKVYSNLDNPFFVVVSESMIPTLNVGDVVAIKTNKNNDNDDSNFNNLKKGDVIVFIAPFDKTGEGKNRTIIHRVVDISSSFNKFDNNFTNSNKKIIKTKGDANNQSYYGLDYPITKNLYKGKVFLVIPQIGKLFNNSLFNIQQQ
ncbi:MAG TPA: signal peptidase I [Nitrososphaeraceae archaeon]|nr:signal peptidase I [Nitrososphaeraceae archaeon]